MPSAHHRHVLLAVLALCAAGLAGCNVNVSHGSYYVDGDHSALQLNVQEGTGAVVDSVTVSVNGQSHPMTLSGQTWTYAPARSPAKGLKVRYEVAYHYSSWLIGSGQKTVHDPAAGEWTTPILDRDADSDADAGVDRNDPCIYNADNLCSTTAPSMGHLKIDPGPAGDPVYRTEMQDDTGNVIVPGFHAYKLLNYSIGRVTEVVGKNSAGSTPAVQGITGLSDAPLSVQVSDCALVYQDTDGGRDGRFVEVYAASAQHLCKLLIEQDGRTLLTGTEVLITVRTNVAPGAAQGTGELYGRVTLAPPGTGASSDEQALFKALTGNAASVPYAYFRTPGLGTLERNGQLGVNAKGWFRTSSYFVFPAVQ